MDDLFQLRLTLDGLGQRFTTALAERTDMIRKAVEAETKRICTPAHMQDIVRKEFEVILRQEVQRKVRIHLLKNDSIQDKIDDVTDQILVGILRGEEKTE